MHAIAARLTSPLLTPRDFKSYYRILNRNLYTRNISVGPHALCRLCNSKPERFSHLGDCHIMRETFQPLQAFASRYLKDVPLDDRLVYLGLAGTRILPILHLMQTLALTIQALGHTWNNSADLLTVWTMHLHLKCRPSAALGITMHGVVEIDNAPVCVPKNSCCRSSQKA